MAQGVKYTAEEKLEIIETIKPYLQLGYTVTRACEYAEVGYQRVYEWMDEDEALRRKIKAWQGMVNTQARQNIIEYITGNKKKGIEPDLETSKWWAERREREDFSTRQENINTGATIQEIMAEFDSPPEAVAREEDTEEEQQEEQG